MPLLNNRLELTIRAYLLYANSLSLLERMSVELVLYTV